MTTVLRKLRRDHRYLSTTPVPNSARARLLGPVGLIPATSSVPYAAGLAVLTGAVVALAGVLGMPVTSTFLLAGLGTMVVSYATGALFWRREVRARVMVTREVFELLNNVRRLASAAEALDPSAGRDELLDALTLTSDGLLSVGAELARAGTGSGPAVRSHHEQAQVVVNELSSALDDLVIADRDRREAFALRSDLSGASASLASLRSASGEVLDSAAATKDAEAAAIAELREVQVANAPSERRRGLTH